MIDADELKWLGETPRIAAYRSGANGRSAAEVGIAAALIRGRGNAPAARTVAPAKPKASTSQPRNRVQIVADAVQRDPALKGKAEAALYMLADADLAGLTGEAIVKSLKAGMSVTPPAVATTTKPTTAPKRSDALGGGEKPTQASASAWAAVIDRMNAPAR